MRTERKIAVLVVLGTLLLASTFAAADSQSYTDVNAWLQRSTNLTTVNFTGIAPVGSYTNIGGNLTTGGAEFSNGATLWVVDPSIWISDPNHVPTYPQWPGNGLESIRAGGDEISMPPPASFGI